MWMFWSHCVRMLQNLCTVNMKYSTTPNPCNCSTILIGLTQVVSILLNELIKNQIFTSPVLVFFPFAFPLAGGPILFPPRPSLPIPPIGGPTPSGGIGLRPGGGGLCPGLGLSKGIGGLGIAGGKGCGPLGGGGINGGNGGRLGPGGGGNNLGDLMPGGGGRILGNKPG